MLLSYITEWSPLSTLKIIVDGNFGKFHLSKTANRAKRIIILIINKVVQIWNIKKFSKLDNTLKKLTYPIKTFSFYWTCSYFSGKLLCAFLEALPSWTIYSSKQGKKMQVGKAKDTKRETTTRWQNGVFNVTTSRSRFIDAVFRNWFAQAGVVRYK